MTKTLVTFLLDRTGSMGSIREATIEAFNGYLDALRKDESGISFTLVQFDSVSTETMIKDQSPKEVPDLTLETFQPRASTPLIDAVYKTIKAVEAKVKDEKVVICIQTDGEENASREHTWDQLNDLIKEKTNAGWQFNFMGAGIDAYKQASRMGLGSLNTMSYNKDNLAQTKAAFSSRGTNTALYASGATSDMHISSSDKRAAGDRFDPGHAGKPEQAKPLVDDVKI